MVELWSADVYETKKDEDEKHDVVESTGNRTQKESIHELAGFLPVTYGHNISKPRIIFVLEKASLTLAYVGRRYQILNPNEHADYLRKKNMNPYDYRPDIIHEALCEIMSSRLCKAGRVDAVYVKTYQGVLIKVEPSAQIPKSLKSFCAMMSELLQKLSIKARVKGGKLLCVVENPITKYLPVNSVKIGLSCSSQKAVKLRDYISTVDNDLNLVFVVGAMAHGKIESNYIDDFISGGVWKESDAGGLLGTMVDLAAQAPEILFFKA